MYYTTIGAKQHLFPNKLDCEYKVKAATLKVEKHYKGYTLKFYSSNL